MSHGWLQTMEETFIADVEHLYFMVLDDDVLVGAACYIHRPTDDVFGMDDAIFGRYKPLARRLGFSALPALICGPLRAYGQHFIYHADLKSSQRREVATALFDAIERVAANRRLSIGFNNVMVEQRELARQLDERGYGRTINFPLNYADIRWKTLAEYRRFLAKRKLTREINKNQKEGVSITRLQTVGNHADRLHQLLDGNFQKYNGKSLTMRSDFAARCKKHLGNNAIIYVAIKNGNIVGTTILFHRGGIAYVSDVGVDHDTCGNDFTYFNLTYYRPFADAIAMGIERIYYGTMMYTMKAKRGCSAVETSLFYRPRSRLLQIASAPLFTAHASIKSWFIRRFHS